MRKSFICLRCSRQLLRSYHQIRKSSFVSLGKLVSDNDSGEQAAQEVLVASQGGVKGRKQRPKKRLSFAKQYQESRKPSGVDKVLETLFSSNRILDYTSERSRYSRTPKEQRIKPATHEKSIDHRLQELHIRLQQGTSTIEDVWTSCQELLGQKIWKPFNEPSSDEERSLSVSVSTAFRYILLAICSKQRLVIDDVTTTPADVIQIYQKHGVMRYWWHEVLWAQLAQIVRSKYENKDGSEEKDTTVDIRTLLKENLEVWNLFLQKYGAIPSSMSVRSDVPESLVNANKVQPVLPPDMVSRFLRLVPKHPPGSHARQISPAAILTFEVTESEGLDCAPVVSQFFKRLRKGRVVNRQFAMRCLADAGVPSDIIDRSLARWGHLAPEEATRVAVKRQQQRLPQLRELDWSGKSLWRRLSEIDDAFKRADAEEAVEFWQIFHRFLLAHEDVEEVEASEILFSRFLRGFWSLRRPDQALAVWNVMISTGRTPKQTHWKAMIAGCEPTRDSKSMQEIWSNMLRLGVEPDNKTWTTYIHGLISCNKIQEGFQALEQLGRAWGSKLAANSPVVHGKQSSTTDELEISDYGPSMEPVHGALTALILIQRFDLIQAVIRWAEAQDLRLTTHTFNVLLRPIVRTGTQAQIQSHLAQMQIHACVPDVITFTIILNGLISNPTSHFHSLTPEEQEKIVTSILAEMSTHNIVPSPKTYSTLLDGVTGKTNPKKEKSINVPLARTILTHMYNNKVPPSPHTYTILITHYFSCQPPDYPAIDSLLENITHSNNRAALDPIFYDRIIEGYAWNGETEKALMWLRKVPEEGKTPGYVALYRVLRALVEREEWELAGELVRDVEDPGAKGLLRHGVGSWKGKSSFWELVDELRGKGLVEEPVGMEQER